MNTKPSTDNKKRKKNLFDPKVDVNEYNRIARHSAINTLQLVHSDFTIKPNFFSERSELALSQSSNVSDLHYDADNNFVIGFLEFRVTAKHSRRTALACKCDFIVVYDLPENALENEARMFCAKVGVFAAYPYFRAFVSHVSSLADADLPILPVISTGPLKKADKESSVE